MRLSVCKQLTFVSDEVSAEDDEQAEKDEDDNRHHASDHGVVHSRVGRHDRGGLRREPWDVEGKRRGGRIMNIWK